MLVKISNREAVSSDDEPVVIRFTPDEMQLLRQMPEEEHQFFSYPKAWSMARGAAWVEESQDKMSPPKARASEGVLPPAMPESSEGDRVELKEAVPPEAAKPETPVEQLVAKPETPVEQSVAKPQTPTMQRAEAPPSKPVLPAVPSRTVPPTTVLSDSDMISFLDGKITLATTPSPKPAVAIPASFQVVQPGKDTARG